MLVVELAFTPAPERLAARPAHRETLTRLHTEGHLLAAGPWSDDEGALLVFATDRAHLEKILDTDPTTAAPPASRSARSANGPRWWAGSKPPEGRRRR
jgi:uncharacterized protein YciI